MTSQTNVIDRQQKKAFETRFERIFGQADEYHPRLNNVEIGASNAVTGIILSNAGFIRVRFPEDHLVSFEAVRGCVSRAYEVEVVSQDTEENVKALWDFIWKSI